MRDFLKKAVTFAKNHPVAISSVAVAVVGIIAANAWGPTRQTFTVEKPADFITFNSMTNNPNIGDERDFVGIRAKDSTDNKWHNNMKIQGGKEYYIRMYVHNNAATNLNLVAENVTAKMNLPTTTGRSITVDGLISSSNAKPQQVWDNATFTGDEDFNIAYVAGSAKFENNAIGKNGGVQLPDSLLTNTGARLGYDKLDGKIPGCFQYAGYVTVLVRAQTAQQPATPKISLNKTVRKDGEKEWKESVEAKSGETVEFQIHAKNVSATTIDNLVIRDVLPSKGFEYVAGSAKLLNQSNPKGLAITGDLFGNAGVNVGKYLPKGDAYVRFKAKVASNDKLPVCGNNTLTNLAQAKNGNTVQSDTAQVVVKKDCSQTPPPVQNPIFECKSLTVKKIRSEAYPDMTDASRREITQTIYQANISYNVSNTTITGVRYVVKTSNGTIYKEQTVKAGENFEFTINNSRTEKFTITATIITANGENTNANCQTTIEVKEPTIPPTPTPTPTPIVICDNVRVVKISRTRFTINIDYTIKNTTFIGITFIIRDNSGKIIREISSKDGKITIDLTISGKYTIEAIINGKTDAKCSTQIIIEDEPKVNTPSISIAKTVNGVKNLTTPENTDFNYEITVSNTGNVDLKDVKVTDKAPENIKFFTSDKGEIKDQVLTYTIPTLKIGASETITIKSQALKVGKMKNIACVDTPTIPGDNDGCDSANVEVPTKNVPVTPTPTPSTPQTPAMPAELPKTGAEIFGAIIAVFSLVTAGGYYIASLKK